MPARAKYRCLLLPAALLSVLGSALPASSATHTAFQSSSEGCSGGGDVCGTFPLIPTGSASYRHRASGDGSVEVTASTEGGIPVTACLPAACPPGRYHAEALSSVWIDVAVPAGSPTIDVAAVYRLDRLLAEAEATIGDPRASLSGSLSISAVPSGLCSDGSAVTGTLERAIGPESAPGLEGAETTIACASASGALPAVQLRVGLSIAVSATSDGGTAAADSAAQLLSVQIDAGG